MNIERTSTELVLQHALADSHPGYTEGQFLALKLDIEKHGQKVPATFYRGKLVDGRHRLRAVKELNIDTLLFVSLPNNLTLAEVKDEVLATEVRRHQSPTQLAIKAYRFWKIESITQEEAVKVVGASATNLKLVNKLVKYGRLDIIDILESGGKVDTGLGINYERLTDSLSAIVKYLDLKSGNRKLEVSSSVKTKEKSNVVIDSNVKVMEMMAENFNDESISVAIAMLYKMLDGRNSE